MASATTKPTISRSGNFWRNLSDDDLLNYRFAVSEPEMLEGMSTDPPPPGQADVEFAYDVKGRDAGKASCVHCRHNNNHYRGFVIRHADNSRRMVGIDCGRKVYGVDFELMRREFSSARDKATALRLKRETVAARGVIMNGLEDALRSGALRQFHDVRNALRDFFHYSLAAKLSDIAFRGGPLTIDERVRDYAAEEKRSEDDEQIRLATKGMNKQQRRAYRSEHGLKPHAGEPLYKYVTHRLGNLQGGVLFRPPKTYTLETLKPDLWNAFHVMSTASGSAHKLSEAQKRLMHLVRLLEEDIRALQAPVDFFEYTNLENVARWATHNDEGSTYRAGIGYIESGVRRVSFPTGYKAPAVEFVAAFRERILR